MIKIRSLIEKDKHKKIKNIFLLEERSAWITLKLLFTKITHLSWILLSNKQLL